MTWIAIALVTAAVNVLVAEVAGWLPWLAERIVRQAVRLLPKGERRRYEDEWLAELDALPGRGISAIVFAFRIFVRTREVGRELGGGLIMEKRRSRRVERALRLAREVADRDSGTRKHLVRVSAYCDVLARQQALSSNRRALLRVASRLHDIGKVAVPDSILLKPGRLSPEERNVIEQHPENGYRLLAGSDSEVLQLGALIARTHQERWDGSGFPQGFHGEEIPLEGRILAIADVFECLTSDRVYRAAFSIEDAVDMMREQSGRHFDPDLLDSFFDALPEVQAVYAALAPNCRLASYRPGAACDST